MKRDSRHRDLCRVRGSSLRYSCGIRASTSCRVHFFRCALLRHAKLLLFDPDEEKEVIKLIPSLIRTGSGVYCRELASPSCRFGGWLSISAVSPSNNVDSPGSPESCLLFELARLLREFRPATTVYCTGAFLVTSCIPTRRAYTRNIGLEYHCAVSDPLSFWKCRKSNLHISGNYYTNQSVGGFHTVACCGTPEPLLPLYNIHSRHSQADCTVLAVEKQRLTRPDRFLSRVLA